MGAPGVEGGIPDAAPPSTCLRLNPTRRLPHYRSCTLHRAERCVISEGSSRGASHGSAPSRNGNENRRTPWIRAAKSERKPPALSFAARAYVRWASSGPVMTQVHGFRTRDRSSARTRCPNARYTKLLNQRESRFPLLRDRGGPLLPLERSFPMALALPPPSSQGHSTQRFAGTCAFSSSLP